MPRTLCAGSTDRCGRFSAFWWSLPGSGRFSLSDQSKDSDLDEEIPLTDSDIESSSAASIWVSNYLTCRRKSVEQTEARSSSGAKLRRDPIKPQEEDGEMQWDYTATQQAFSKRDSACSTLVPPPRATLQNLLLWILSTGQWFRIMNRLRGRAGK
ncbi:hypothetical protein NDU88_000442 [Pleurodeles waltl]|uniref:Uncharacterized protein n=1 Tax=Pleurodeles waltl TaxID=8319 RepID=A0AAV7URW1_PLEWA|nr:hypothetical protein NDU88_000442 [Pleurodeles waltl]